MIDGTDQRQRGVPALQETLLQVDPLGLPQRVALARALAAQLRFVNLHNQEAGTWVDLFEQDESLVLAAIAGSNPAALKRRYQRLCGWAEPERLVQETLALAAQLDGWHQALAGSPLPAAVAVRDAIRQRVTRQLAGQLAALLAPWAGAASDGRTPGDRARGLQDFWRSAAAAPAAAGAGQPAPPAAPHSTTTPATPPATDRAVLRSIHLAFVSTVGHVSALAAAQLPHTLDSGRHEAAPGLLLAFFRLYDTVQAQVNTLAGRHVDFYYHQVLGAHPHAAVPDTLHAACLRDPRSAQDVWVPAGTVFPAGKDRQGQPVAFGTMQPLAVGAAQVAALATLRLQREPRIAPEGDLGYVTSIRAHWMGARKADAPPIPALGGGPGARTAETGLVVASPLLALKEGTRRIVLGLPLEWSGPGLDGLLQDALDCHRAATLRRALGRLFARWLLSTDASPAPARWARLRRHARALMPEADTADSAAVAGQAPASRPRGLDAEQAPLHLMCEAAALAADGTGIGARERAFHRYATDLFSVSLSHAGGWLALERPQLARPPGGSGLQLTLRLRPEDPAITACDPALHGALQTRAGGTQLPLLRLLVNPRSRIHPCTLLAGAQWLQATLQVQVQGVGDLQLANHLGPLDASKAFAPFGPLPTLSSYLALASPEAACKSLDSLHLHLQWSGLPTEPGGWAAHYAAYGDEQANGPYTVALSILRDGQWQACGGASAAQPLFADAAPGRPLPERQSFEVDPVSLRQHARASSEPLRSGTDARNGWYRLQLQQPRGAFGHAAYATLLGEAVSTRTRRRGAQPLPRLPYTPTLERISLDYSASAVLVPGQPVAPGPAGDARLQPRLLHIHPWGVADVAAGEGRRPPGLLPDLGPDASLSIGLQAPALEGPLTLLFQLREQASEPGAAASAGTPGGAATRRPSLQWQVLAQDRWQPLAPHRVLSDTTHGLLTSGVVTLDLPPGLQAGSSLMAAAPGLYWLRASLSTAADTAAALVTVQAQGLTLQRVLAADKVAGTGAGAGPGVGSGAGAGLEDTTLQPVPPLRLQPPQPGLPGLAAVVQGEPSRGGRAAEDGAQMRRRIGERLRHKNRASLAWDVERLVLEAFPEVFKVRCWRAQDIAGQPGIAPGHALVVVVPQTPRNDPAWCTASPRLDALTLQRIQDFVTRQASPWTRLQVCNAAYERVQVRARLQLHPGVHSGAVLRQANQALLEYLSPWHDTGLGPRLDWQLRCDEVQTQLRRVPGVALVGPVSLLHVVRRDDGRWRLGDTVQATAGGSTAASPVLRHHRPWSLLLPMATHLLELLDGQAPGPAEVTGLRRLRVGGTLIVSRARQARAAAAAEGAP